MKKKICQHLRGMNVLYSYPNAQHQVLEWFASMVSHKYSLFMLLEGDVVDVSVLKKKVGALDPYLNLDGASCNV